MLAQWEQWLRHTRAAAPTVDELLEDEERKIRIKELARIADEKWKQGAGGAFAIGSPEEALKGSSLLKN
jgi:hypothetical protein